MKVLVLEDENLTAQRLQNLLLKYDASIEILEVIPSVSEAVKWFTSHPDPDLVFMDIHLEDGQSFSIYDQINLDVPVIFTTAYDDYMIKAFKVNSVDYLMKPINFDELVAAIEKYKRIHESEQPNMQSFIETVQQQKEPTYKDRFLVSIGSRLKTIELDEISYFYSADKITFLVTKDNARFPIDFSLDKLSLVLDPKHFFRINRQMMVRLRSINNIHVFTKGRLKLDLQPASKEEVFVSLDKVTEFKEWLGK